MNGTGIRIHLALILAAVCGCLFGDIAAAETRIVGTLVGEPLGVLDPGRVKKTLEIVSGAYTLKFPVTAEDLYAAGFVN
jgi:hypothetical protein